MKSRRGQRRRQTTKPAAQTRQKQNKERPTPKTNNQTGSAKRPIQKQTTKAPTRISDNKPHLHQPEGQKSK
jgi:hypothetical protein